MQMPGGGLEEMALTFAERIGGGDDLDIAQTFAAVSPSNRQSDSSES
jgi:hypothetical protein